MGMMYRGGVGVPHDPVKSKEYFGKACDMGDQDSCRLTQ
jgi:TPR repeat protein